MRPVKQPCYRGKPVPSQEAAPVFELPGLRILDRLRRPHRGSETLWVRMESGRATAGTCAQRNARENCSAGLNELPSRHLGVSIDKSTLGLCEYPGLVILPVFNRPTKRRSRVVCICIVPQGRQMFSPCDCACSMTSCISSPMCDCLMRGGWGRIDPTRCARYSMHRDGSAALVQSMRLISRAQQTSLCPSISWRQRVSHRPRSGNNAPCGSMPSSTRSQKGRCSARQKGLESDEQAPILI